MKINNIIVIIFISFFSMINVFALDDIYYENNNNVKFTEIEYNYFTEIYNFNYIENMTSEEYEWYSDLKINDNNFEVETYYDVPISIMSTSHTTPSKKISITKSCSSTKCNINTSVIWLVNPVIRSYDVIGARFDGTNLADGTILTKVKSSAGTSVFNNLNSFQNGFGVSIELPNNATNIIIEQRFYTTTSGMVYASYQHATSNITLNTSKLYTISSNGYGGVFNFFGNALNKFDRMGGVSITL